MTVALFCGSREWTDPEPIRHEISKLESGDLVIHGDQRGADLIADTEARRIGLEVISVAADWGIGPSAGPIRNDKMLKHLLTASKDMNQPVRVLAFHHDTMLGVGTRDMVRKSIKAGIRAVVFLSLDAPFIRIGTHVDCEICGLPYRKHPFISSKLDSNGDPFLHLSCDGMMVWR